MIYRIKNIRSYDYVVQDDPQLVIANGTNKRINSIVNGNESLAAEILHNNQIQVLALDMNKLYINREISDTQNNTEWTAINIAKESIAPDTVYILFNPITGNHEKIFGVNLYQEIDRIQHQILQNLGMGSIEIVTTIPSDAPINRPQPTVVGMQTV